MIIPKYTIASSKIPNAGQGLFLAHAVEIGNIIVAPDNITNILSFADLQKFEVDSIEHRSNVRWFEEFYTITPEWSDECYINHSFTPTGLWHLGFIFAIDNLPAGAEVTIDYRLLISEHDELDFKDSQTGQPVVGFSWKESITQSTAILYGLLQKKAGAIN
jgi:hypothetical protein